jgi:TFIIS helical bundle-like domain
MDELFTIVEKYEHMTVGHLQFSKIGKVMRHIQSQGEDKIPRDTEFKFRERAKVLVEKWHTILNSSKTNGTASALAADKSHGGDEDAKGEDDTTGMDVDAKGEPDLAAEDKENVPAEGADLNMSVLEGDISALGDTIMTGSAA